MTLLTLNVVSIVVGVLIVRIIVVWFNSFRTYVESKIDTDPDESLKDWEEFKRDIVGAITVTGVAGILIIVIIEWYRDEADKEEHPSGAGSHPNKN